MAKPTVAFVYPKSSEYFNRLHNVPLYENFFLQDMPKQERIRYESFAVEDCINARAFSNFNAVIFWSCADTILNIKHADELKCVKVVYGQDPIDMNEAWQNKYRDCQFDFVVFHAMREQIYNVWRMPPDICYHTIIPGVSRLYHYPFVPFESRRKDKIVCMGSYANLDTPLRTLMVKASQVKYVPVECGFVSNKFGDLLKTFQAACTSMANFIVPKYVELSMSGCLAFLGSNYVNGIEELGFEDGVSCVYVCGKNYLERFDAYLNTTDDPKWEQIATNGRTHVLEKWESNKQASKLVDLILERL